MATVSANKSKKLTLMGFFALTASMVMTVYEFPAFASSGAHLVFFLLIGGFLWFIPVSLCAAEMATVKGWETGGIFTWVERTLGPKWGFAAVFYQWFQITVGFVTMIYFIIGCLSLAFNWTALNDDPWLKLIATLIIFWLITFSQFAGTALTARIAKFGFFVGVLSCGILLFILAIVYLATGGDFIVPVSHVSDWIPSLDNVSALVIFVSFVLAYAGVESSASRANEMENPGRDYPIAMIMLVVVAILVDIFGGFSVAATVPADKIGLNTGVIQAFDFLISHFGGASWIVSIIAIVIALGVVAEVAAWVVGPSYALLRTAQEGLLPKGLTKTNNKKVPVRIVLIQGLVVSVWIFVLTLSGGANLSFFIAMALTVCIYLVAYALLFIGYIVLIEKHPNYPRVFKIPGPKGFKIIVAIVGLIITIGAFLISFVAPSGLGAITNMQYFWTLFICWAVMVVVPFIIYEVYGRKHYIPAKIDYGTDAASVITSATTEATK